jgi:hypothetical protein
MVTTLDFRDKRLASLLVGYDWFTGQHFAELTIASADESLLTYRIAGLSAWSVFEDFQSVGYIEQCTFLREQPGVYLSLDPFLEGQRSAKDNQWFIGIDVERVPRSNNSLERTRER